MFVCFKVYVNFAPANDSWCNGCTRVFGIVSQGSSPCESTKKLQFIEAFFVFNNFNINY